MDISSIIKSLDISSVWMFFLRIFGGKGAVYEYVIGKALNSVNALTLANNDKVQSVREKMAVINGYAVKYAGLLPVSWIPYAEHLNKCFITVYQASEDGKFTTDEFKAIVNDFKVAYADYMDDL